MASDDVTSRWRKDPKTRPREEHQEDHLGRLRARQRAKREWISVKDIAEFYGHDPDPNTIDQKRLEAAYLSIYYAVQEFYFGIDRRTSTIRYLAPGRGKEAKETNLVPARLREFHETDGDLSRQEVGPAVVYVLAHSWIRWDAFDAWCDRTNRQDLKKHLGRKATAELGTQGADPAVANGAKPGPENSGRREEEVSAAPTSGSGIRPEVSDAALGKWFSKKVSDVKAGLCARPSQKGFYILANKELDGHVTRDRTNKLYSDEGLKRSPGRPRKEEEKTAEDKWPGK